MKKSAVSLALGIALATAAYAGEVAPNSVYKWTDVKGVIHYSDRPAFVAEKARDERAIGKNDLAAGDNALAQKTLANDIKGVAEQKRAANDAEKNIQEQIAANDARKKACQNAQEVMRLYSSGSRVSAIGERGEKTFLSDADIQSKLAQATKVAEDVCSPAKPIAPPPAPAPAPVGPPVAAVAPAATQAAPAAGPALGPAEPQK